MDICVPGDYISVINGVDDVGYEVIDGLDLFNKVPGWRLHLAHLGLAAGDHDPVLDVARRGSLATLRRRFPDGDLGSDATIVTVREALRAGGSPWDPPRSSAERILDRVLDGGSLETGHPALQLRDILVLRTLLPWTVIDAESLLFPLVFRRGEKGETAQVDGAAISLQGLPMLTHAGGAAGTPCAPLGDETITDDTTQVVLVCYTPLSIAREYTARTELARLVWMTWAFQFIMERAYRPVE